MFKYAKIINEETKQCDVGIGTNESFYKSLGMTLQEVEESYTGMWYLQGFAPKAPEPTYAQQRATAYPPEVDQLDKLYHDIDGGLFGEAPKTSDFYLARKEVKDAYPKVLEGEVDEVENPAEKSAEVPVDESANSTHSTEGNDLPEHNVNTGVQSDSKQVSDEGEAS